jgi:catechol 2,3-dioxygenase-like lactoylglutathione lyase family enzyme
MGLGYVRLRVRDFDACVAFYRDTISLPVAILAEFDTGEAALDLLQHAQGQKE